MVDSIEKEALYWTILDAFREPERVAELSEAKLSERWRDADLRGVLSVLGSLDEIDAVRRKVIDIVEKFLASGTMPVKTKASKARLAQLEKVVEHVAQGVTVPNAHDYLATLRVLKSRAKTLDVQNGVEIVIGLVEFTLTEKGERFSLATTAGSVGHAMEYVASDLADRFAEEIRAEHRKPTLSDLASLAGSGICGPEDPFARLVGALLHGPEPLARELKGHGWGSEDIVMAWEQDERPAHVMALAALSCYREPFLVAAKRIAGTRPNFVKAYQVIEKVPESFSFGRVHAAYRLGLMFGTDAELARVFRSSLELPSVAGVLAEALFLFSELPQSSVISRLKSVLFR